MYEWIGFFLVLTLGIAMVLGPWNRGISNQFRKLLVVGVLLRGVGACLRHFVLFQLYNGVGDAAGYYNAGLHYATSIYALDFSFLWNGDWFGRRWWGTQFVRTVSGFVVALVGPSMRGEFLFFSLMSLLGLYLLMRSFQHAFPSVPIEKYARWLIFCPSLLFWPSSVGKEALSLIAIGLAVYGYTRSGSRHWFLLGAGLLLAFCIRPHLAGFLVFSMAFVHWTMQGSRSRGKFVLEGTLILLLGASIGYGALTAFGLDDANLEELQTFMSDHSIEGGSFLDTPSGGILKIPMAFVNVLFRPFIWEASGAGLLSAVEVLFFWTMVWIRRKRILASLKSWRKQELLCFTVAFSIIYVLTIGMVIINLGILARQRTLVIPFLLLCLETIPAGDAASRLETARPRWNSRRYSRASALNRHIEVE